MSQNFKFQISNFKLRRGFTLIELLVVVVVLAIVGSIVTGVITFSIRGTNKTNTIENIRQSGNYTISQMSKTIEYARSFDGLSTDGNNYVTSCPATNAPAPTSTDYSYIKVTPFNSSSIVYSCSSVSGVQTVAYQQPPTATAVSLIDTTSVRVPSCSFTCIVNSATDSPIIRISFRLQPAGSSTLVEKFTTPITFETSVTMRNYQK